MPNRTPDDFDAIYEKGTFRTVGESIPALPDGTRVKITVEPTEEVQVGNVLDLATAVYDGLTAEEIAEVERIATDRSSFFVR